MGSAVVRAGIDTSVVQASASANYSASAYLNVRGGASAAYAFLWLKSPAPLGATISVATLRVYGRGDWGAGADSLSVQRIAATWTASRVTWNAKPAVTGAVVTRAQESRSSGVLWEINVTALVQAIANGAGNYGFRIALADTVLRTIFGLKASDYRPELSVEWSDAPAAPHTLTPDGGRAVSVAKPVLQFDYTDVSGSTTLDAIQVQIDATGNWAAPAFDSGTVLSDDPELDLSATAYAGLALAATTHWRVRVRDAAGLWSDWSDDAIFTRLAQPTIRLDSPAIAPNNYVSEWTPPIMWTILTGAQAAFQLLITDDTDPSRVLYDSRKRTGTDDSLTLPEKVLTSSGDEYRLELRIWDGAARASTIGDPAYASAVLVFTFENDVAVTPVTALVVDQSFLDRPWAYLSWTRGTAPDSFSVLRDGVIIASGLDPADLVTTPTHYAWIDKDAYANRNHTWAVQAVVNRKSSPSVAATFKLISTAVWLTDPTTDRLVAILNVESPNFEMPDSSAVYEPMGTSSVVRITQTQRGLQGSISGLLTDFAGASGATFSANMLWMKQRPHLPVRLTIGQQSMRVLIGNVLIAPVEFGEDDRAVSFDFWSLDGVTA